MSRAALDYLEAWLARNTNRRAEIFWRGNNGGEWVVVLDSPDVERTITASQHGAQVAIADALTNQESVRVDRRRFALLAQMRVLTDLLRDPKDDLMTWQGEVSAVEARLVALLNGGRVTVRINKSKFTCPCRKHGEDNTPPVVNGHRVRIQTLPDDEQGQARWLCATPCGHQGRWMDSGQDAYHAWLRHVDRST